MRFQPTIAVVICFASVQLPMFRCADACTVFTLTDGQRILFCDNEDYSNPRTRIWFVPPSGTKNGYVLLGFDDGWGQNGLNDRGLAYGWVAGFKERWERQPDMKSVRGGPCHRMLESCKTVEDAIAFFEEHWEESFSYGKLLVADRTCKSVVLGAKDGKLHAPVATRSQGIGHRFGMRGDEATHMLPKIESATLSEAAKLLDFTRQEGMNATKYSVVFDLNTRDIWLYRFPKHSNPVQFSLSRELKKEPHYYEIPALSDQKSQKPKPLTEEMKKL
jgi:hypothetical protein